MKPVELNYLSFFPLLCGPDILPPRSGCQGVSGGPSGEHLAANQRPGMGAADQSEARHWPRSLGYQEAVVRLLLVLRRKQLVMEEKGKQYFLVYTSKSNICT